MILTFYLTPKNVFVVLLLNYAPVSFFCIEKGLGLFAAYLANSSCLSLKYKSFPCFSPKLQCPHLFHTGNGLRLFEGNHVLLT